MKGWEDFGLLPSPDRARPHLIKTKFSAPQLRAGLVLRPRLMRLLADGVTRPLTLICAPAGYGKTTLLAEWIASLDGAADRLKPTVCWLSLDQNDDEPALFLNYLVTALGNNRVPADCPSLAILSVFPLPPIQTILGLLINDLVDRNDPILLILDDYQFITHPVIQEGLAFFIDHLPTNVHLVLLTRSDPPFPLARLRVRGQLTEIRADDLRFTIEETACFLNHEMALGLTAEYLAQLDERTEGWAAGLQMAALALTNQPDTAVFVKNFSGSHRYILDYLIEEVLTYQPGDIQSFLLQTSVLENLCASLCDAVISPPARDRHRSSQQILEYLEHANLFLIPLDSERNWYRYHHLFADLLCARLDQQDPGLTCELHSRASRWYEHHQHDPEAIEHALAGGAVERACTLIEAQAPYRLIHNGMGMLLNWIQKLPEETANSRPWLCIAQAWSMMFSNMEKETEPLLQAAERNISPDTPTELQNEWRGQIACLRAAISVDIYDGTQPTIDLARQALSALSPANMVHRTFAKFSLGRMYFLSSDFSRAVPILVENSRDCMTAGATNYLAPTLNILSKIHRMQGQLKDTIELLREGRAYIEACDPRQVSFAGGAFIGQADVLREWDQLEAAEALAKRSVDLVIPWENPSAICTCYTTLIRIYLAQGKPALAEAALNAALKTIKGRKPMAGVINELNYAQVWFWLSTGQAQIAAQWMREQSQRTPARHTHLIYQELDEITFARVMIAEGQPDHALQALEPLAEAAKQFGRFGRLIEIYALQALALQAHRKQEQALKRLENALRLAEPQGYLRIFLDEGESMRALLAAYLKTLSTEHRGYAQKIISAFVAGNPTPAQAKDSHCQETHPDDVLTAREIEVLGAMAEGLSNRQIADRLILAEGTIKFYIHSVYEKLEAHNRTQALLEAKKRNLVSSLKRSSSPMPGRSPPGFFSYLHSQ